MVDLCVTESELGAVGAREEAVEILTAARRRLAKRLAVAVVMNKQQLLGRGTLLNSPLTCDRDLAEIAAGLCQVDQAIAALRPGRDERLPEVDCKANRIQPAEDHRSRTFSWYAQLVTEKRLEEASRELSRILHMPLDRAVTATHFFARAAQASPDDPPALALLHEQIATFPVADAVRLLMKTFGFQAIESRVAMEALRSACPHPGPA